MGKNYVLDDTFQISEEVQNMSEEEMHEQAGIWEEEGRRERKKIKEKLYCLSKKGNPMQQPSCIGFFYFVWVMKIKP